MDGMCEEREQNAADERTALFKVGVPEHKKKVVPN